MGLMGRYEGKTLNEATIQRCLGQARREGWTLVRRDHRWNWRRIDGSEIEEEQPTVDGASGYATRSDAICARYRVEAMMDPWRS